MLRLSSALPKRNVVLNRLIPHKQLTQHVARISSTCINNIDANPSNATHGSQTKKTMTLDIKLPDLAGTPELPGPDIPFLPDFWDSSRARGDHSIRHDVAHEAPMRPILVVAGASSQQSVVGLTYEEHSNPPTLEHSEPSKPTPPPRTGLWADILDDLGIPPDVSIANPFKNLVSIRSENGSSEKRS